MPNAKDTNPLSGLYNDFVAILKDLVVKYVNEAENYETLATKKAGDAYVAAYYKMDTFLSYNYTTEDFNEVGIHDKDLIIKYSANRRLIPVKYRDALLKRHREKFVGYYQTTNGITSWVPGTYVEKNEYYRKLAGMPPLDATEDDFIYVSREIGETYGISTTTPLHQLSSEKLSILDEIGYLDEIRAIYSGEKYAYLDFMASRSIPVAVARKAKNFSLLRMSQNVNSDVMVAQFKQIYEQCRIYFVETIYSYMHSKIITGYDNFIGLSIMIMAMQQIIMRQIKIVIDRDFFDTELIKWLFDAYSVPYIHNLSFNIKKSLAQNLNHLIQYKGTNRVLFDIGTILGIDHLIFYKYYLMKVQKYGEDGEPVVATREETDDYGVVHTVPDYESMYDVYFQKVELDDPDYLIALKEYQNMENYREVTENDPLWWEDEDLYEELYDEAYNYKETKYLSMSIAYRMSEIMFDTTYLLRLLIDKKEEVSHIQVLLPRILGTEPTNLFTCVIALCAMTAKMHGLAGDILVEPSKILHILGFNFTHDFDKIREDIASNPLLDSNEILKYLQNMTAYTADSVNKLYNNIVDLAYFLEDAMADATDKDVYHAYYDLYRALYITQENQAIFTIPGTEDNPRYAQTYLEYLQYLNADLYSFINDMDVVDIPQYAEHIISRIIQIIPEVEGLYSLINSNSTVVDALIQLVKFFKSHTTELLGLTIVYILDIKALNMLKLIDDLWYIHKIIGACDIWHLSHSDAIAKLKAILKTKEFLPFFERLKLRKQIQIDEDVYSMLYDDLKLIKTIMPKDTNEFYDVLSYMAAHAEANGGIIKFKDGCSYTSVYTLKAPIDFRDSASMDFKSIQPRDHTDLVDVCGKSQTLLADRKHAPKLNMRDSVTLRYVD